MESQAPGGERTFWKRCSSCKKELGFGAKYYVCSVSTCRGKRTGYVFCSVPCWDAHLGYANHRSAFAEDAHAPGKEEYLRMVATEGDDTAPRRLIVQGKPGVSTSSPPSSNSASPNAAPSIPASLSAQRVIDPDLANVETLVVVSKVKKLVKDLSEFNTSECAIDALTAQIASACKRAVENARTAGRRTVMGRDIK
jgi:histone H3/H4